MAKVLDINLNNDIELDNKMFCNLLDDSRWRRLIQQAEEGKPIEELLKELIEGV